MLEGDVKGNMINTLSELDQWMAETAEKMPRSPPRKKIKEDPRIQELIKERAALARSFDGRERFRITTEIRKLITKSTRNKKREAIQLAFERRTNWAKVSEELKIKRPVSNPIFKVNGKSVTSDAEAMEAMTGHIGQIYAKPNEPISIPPWNTNHGVQVGDLIEAVGMAVVSLKPGKAADESGLSNACVRGLKQGMVGKLP